MADRVSEVLTRLRNALQAKHESVTLSYSTIGKNILSILSEEGYVGAATVVSEGGIQRLRVSLKYDSEGKSIIETLEQVSSPGRRVYVRKDDIPRVKGGMGTAIISTSKGLVTDKKARQEGMGGEVVCYIW